MLPNVLSMSFSHFELSINKKKRAVHLQYHTICTYFAELHNLKAARSQRTEQ